MSRDLEEQLDEMGLEYRAVVMRLREAQGAGKRNEGRGKREERRGGWLFAASLLLVVGLGFFFLRPKASRPSSLVPHPSEYTMGISEMIATQNPDGSWKNDFLTRRNAAALRVCGDPAAQVAYKKAMRNLRSRGIL